jgi:DNA-directed RNA polymerase subunit RPC12/RpoP
MILMTDAQTYVGALCVECGACGRRVIFWAMSAEATMPTPDAARRLRCTACEAKRPVLFRATSEAEAKRWYAER